MSEASGVERKTRELIDFWFERNKYMSLSNEMALVQCQLLREISNELDTLNGILRGMTLLAKVDGNDS